LSLTEALVLRSHVIVPMTQPVTSLARLTWLTLQTATGLVPYPRGASAKAPAPAGQAATMDLEQFEVSLDERFGAQRTLARLQLLVDGDAYFPRLVQAVQDARRSILVRLYIFDTDAYALQLADLLKERSKTIEVKVLLDHLGSLAAARAAGRLPYAGGYPYPTAPRSIVEYLQTDSNVKVRTVANPWFTSDHTKAIIVDRERAFLGGMNIGQEYRYEWHDAMVEVEGPVIARLARDFELVWAQAAIGGDLAKFAQSLDRRPEPSAPPSGAVPIRTLYTRTANPEILLAQLAAIRNARQFIYVEQPYVSDDEMIAALVDARRRGVDVRVVLPTAGDSGLMNAANLMATNVFLRNGVRVYAYPGMTHVKAAIYDGWVCLGSANFDKLSLRINRELDVATSDPAFASSVRRDLFERDFAKSREVTEPRSVGWSTYISSFIANQL
jgi:cardiolipin synthase